MNSREGVFFGLAALAHVGGLYAATLFPSYNLLALEKGRPEQSIQFEFEPRKERAVDASSVQPVSALGARVSTPVNPDQPVEAKRNAGTGGTGRAGTNGVETSDGTDSGGDGGTGNEPNPGNQPEDNGWGPTEEEGIPGLGDKPIYMDPSLVAFDTRGAPAQTVAPKEKTATAASVNKGLKDVLREKDKKLGLGLPAAGTVASIFKATVEGSDAPGNAKASYTVALGPGGKVKSVKFNQASAGNSATWEGVARSVKAALASQKLNLTGDYVRGAIIQISVVSKMQMPSGAEVDAGLKLSLTQSFDVADIGAKPVRVVQVSPSATPVN